MNDHNRGDSAEPRQPDTSAAPVKLVAAIPELDKTPEELEEMKLNDGYEGSCGIPRK